MSGSLLIYLDILIGFALVMLLVSSIVTVLSQWLLNAGNYRAVVLREGLKRLLIQVDATLQDQAETIAQAVLLHPLVAGQDWFGKPQQGAAIQREQLVRVLLELATAQMPSPLPEAAKALRKAFDLDETDGNTPKAQLEAIQARVVRLEVESPGTATHVLRACAILENTSAPFVSGVMSWFDETSGRMTQHFAQRARSLTVLLSALVAVALPLDALDLLRRLSLDEALRSRLVEAAQKMEQSQGETAANTEPPKGESVAKDTPPPSEAAPKGEESQQDNPQTSPQLTEVQRLRGELEDLAIIPKGGVWTLLEQEGGCQKLLDAAPGILLSICLLSLGSPFWFEMLKHLLKLRPTLAQTEEKERQERQDVRPANGGMALAERRDPSGPGPRRRTRKEK